MEKPVNLLLCALFTSLLQGSAFAATLDFTETVDLTYQTPGDSVGVLDVGQNFVRGTIESASLLGDSLFDNIDWFNVTLPANLEIVSIAVNVQTSDNIVMNPRQFGTVSVGGRGPDGDEDFNFTGIGNQGGGLSVFAFSSTPSTLEFVVYVNPEFSAIGTLYSAAYEWAIDVDQAAVVPVPAALWLFGAGLFSLIAIAIRKDIQTNRR